MRCPVRPNARRSGPPTKPRGAADRPLGESGSTGGRWCVRGGTGERRESKELGVVRGRARPRAGGDRGDERRMRPGGGTFARCGRTRGGGAAVDPARDARHHAGRCHRARRGRCHHPILQRRRRPRPPVPAGVRDGAGDPAVARVDDDRPVRRGPRHPRERTPRARGDGTIGRAPARRRLPDGRLRIELRPRQAVRPGPWLRHLRRRAACGSAGTHRPRDDRRRALGARRRRLGPAVSVGPLLGPSPSLHAARAVQERVPVAPVSRRSRLHGRGTRAPDPGLRATGERAGRDHPRRRSRRGPRRSRRSAARAPPLSVDDARAPRRGGPERGGRDDRRAGEHPARLSHGARPGRRRVGRQPAGRVDGRGARRGDEAVSRVRLAAADHGRPRAAEVHFRGFVRAVRHRGRSRRDAQPRRRRRPARAAARGPRRLSRAVARRGARSRGAQ